MRGVPSSREVGRNRYVLVVEVEVTHPLSSESETGRGPAQAAAELLASDVRGWLRSADWGYGRARVAGVYAPQDQFAHGDWSPDDGADLTHADLELVDPLAGWSS